jgi:hypothetical protein
MQPVITRSSMRNVRVRAEPHREMLAAWRAFGVRPVLEYLYESSRLDGWDLARLCPHDSRSQLLMIRAGAVDGW